jgi:hypothetical protein
MPLIEHDEVSILSLRAQTSARGMVMVYGKINKRRKLHIVISPGMLTELKV